MYRKKAIFIKVKKFILIIAIIIAIYIPLFIFAHSTVERAMRTNLIFEGYPIKAFKTEIYKSHIDPQYGQQYSCKNPSIGVGFYTCKKNKLGLWFVDIERSGEC